MSNPRLSAIQSSEDYCATLESIKKDVKNSKAKDSYKKFIAKTVDALIKAESNFHELDLFINHLNQLLKLATDLDQAEVAYRLDNKSIIAAGHFLQKYGNDYEALIFDQFDEYKSFVGNYEKSLPILHNTKKELNNLSKAFNISDKDRKLILSINKKFNGIAEDFEDIAKTIDLAKFIEANTLKEGLLSRLNILNKLSSKNFTTETTDTIKVIAERVDTLLAIVSANVPKFNQIKSLRVEAEKKLSQKTALATNPNTFMSAGSAPTSSGVKSQPSSAPRVKK